MPNPQNLKPFSKDDDRASKAGKKSSKRGIPHSKTRLIRLLELTENLTNPITGEVEGFSVAEQLDLKQIIKARQGDTKAYNAILDRLEGKPNQTLDGKVSGDLNVSLVRFIGEDTDNDNNY